MNLKRGLLRIWAAGSALGISAAIVGAAVESSKAANTAWSVIFNTAFDACGGVENPCYNYRMQAAEHISILDSLPSNLIDYGFLAVGISLAVLVIGAITWKTASWVHKGFTSTTT